MAVNKTLIAFILVELLFLVCAGLLIALPLLAKKLMATVPSVDTVAEAVVLEQAPLTASLVNGILMAVAFIFSIPGIFFKKNRLMLKIHTWLVLLCAILSVINGLLIWFSTLRTGSNLASLWHEQPDTVVSLLQQRLVCCGFKDPTHFFQDSICPNAADAARHGTCKGPISAFANAFLGAIFTGVFGIAGVDGLTILAALCVLKERAEQARYKLIDDKNGYRI